MHSDMLADPVSHSIQVSGRQFGPVSDRDLQLASGLGDGTFPMSVKLLFFRAQEWHIACRIAARKGQIMTNLFISDPLYS